jgi:hypothetical protein
MGTRAVMDGEQPAIAIPSPFLFAPDAVGATLARLPALAAALPAPTGEGEPSEAFAGMRKTPRQIYRALTYHDEMPALAELLERVDHWLERGWPATKLRGRAREQFRPALAELEVADHFEARSFAVSSAEAGKAEASAADLIVDADDVRAVVEVHSPVEWEGLDAFQGAAWDTLRNLDLPLGYHFSFDARQRRPIGERGYVPLHPEMLSRALATPDARERLLRPLIDQLLAGLATGPSADVVARHEDAELGLVVDIELSGLRQLDTFVPRSGSWGFDGLGGYRPELMFDDIVKRIARKAQRRQARSDDALEVVIVDMSRVQLQSELVHETYYRPRFAQALRQRFPDERQLPCDIIALCASGGWRQELTTYFLITREAGARSAAERLFGRLS